MIRNGFDMVLETNFPVRADVIANGMAHLRPDIVGLQEVSFIVQELQAQELVTFLDGQTVHPAILVGDLNALPEEDVNQIVVDSGFIDVWPLRIFGWDPGFTCCQAEDLQNEISFLDERIDFTYYRNGTNESSSTRVIPLFASLVGNRLVEKTATVPSLWPSDHGGVFSFLLFPCKIERRRSKSQSKIAH
jgi:endonuclease/exonuclease/phosphatase family metal-dependent hydrolase